jgi:hypothetical protein
MQHKGVLMYGLLVGDIAPSRLGAILFYEAIAPFAVPASTEIRIPLSLLSKGVDQS